MWQITCFAEKAANRLPRQRMASTVWKGQLTFGMVSFPVRLQKAARRERIALKYVRETRAVEAAEEKTAEPEEEPREREKTIAAGAQGEVVPVRQGYFAEGQRAPSSSADLQRGYQVAPDTFVVVRREELKSLRKPTSPEMRILRSVRMAEIDPVFLGTSYYAMPGSGGEKSYSLLYRALLETHLAALAEVAMHGREHAVVLRAGRKGLIAHTMYYVSEVRGEEEYAAQTADVIAKELDLAKKYIEALREPFEPEGFTDSYSERLEALLASKNVAGQAAGTPQPKHATGKVVDIMDALRKSLEAEEAAGARRKPAGSEVATGRKPRKRKA